MNKNSRSLISRTLMELIIDNYRKIEEKYPGYTNKKEAAALINYCCTRGWPDLTKIAIASFSDWMRLI